MMCSLLTTAHAAACAFYLPHPTRAPARASPTTAQVESAVYWTTANPSSSDLELESAVSTAVFTAGFMAALVAAPDIPHEVSYNTWATAVIALPVTACWLLPFFCASDILDGSVALQSGLRASTSLRRASPTLPAKSPWDALSAFASQGAHQMALARAMMALETEVHEEESLKRSTLPSHDTPFAVDSSHEPGMACVEFFSEDDQQLQWVCI